MDQLAPAVPSRRAGGARTRQSILAAATEFFAEKGFNGANVNDIVARAGTTKPMIYYHFGSKEGLFAAVLESVYAQMREIELSTALSRLPPLEAMRELVQVTFDYHAGHPEWIRLISIANIHDAQHIKNSPTIGPANTPVIAILADLLHRGERDGVFRPGIDPLQLHMLIASLCFYRVSNRHTWAVIFARNLNTPAEATLQRAMLVEAVERYLRP